MANAETIPTAHTNGVIEDGYDEDDKSKMRPADIDADMREMERRKRVELIMNSRLFREELERIIESQMRDGNSSAGLLQQISDMVGSKYGTNNHILKNSSCVVPINDIRGIEAMGYAKGEKILRCKLAALFRLIELYGWSQNIYNHITARLSQQEEHFLVNPYGLLYSEITASSLVKVDMQGNVIETGTTNFSVNAGGFQLHAAIYAARPDLKCIVHLHTPSVLAVSSLKDGLLPLCQEAAVVGDVSHHAYIGVPNGPEERDKLVRNLGPNNKVIFLTNHGALCCGETIEETFFYVYNTVSACETQLKVMPFGKDNLILLSDETRKVMYDAARKMPENIAPNPNVPNAAAVAEKRWRVGGLEFEALMRMLDNAGFRTGYVYRQPLIKGEVPRPRNDVEVPPAVSSLGYLLEEEEFYRQGIWRKQNAAKGSDRIRWLNSPNVYQKVEILETGTTDPKKITKWVDANNEEWVAEGSPSHTSTPVKIENALQFVPKNTNPKEFKKLQQQIKDNRRADKITSGPQSHILEGVSWEEAKKLQDANAASNSDQVILVGAASKGIIQREFQHNATVYKTPYAKNPFDAVTDEEIEKYKKDITRKQKGDSYYDEDESDALSSSLPPSGRNITGVTSEEDDSLAHEMRVIQIRTSTAPKASQAEVVLSDDDSRYTQLSVLYTSLWEARKLRATTIVVAVVETATYPTAWPAPTRVRIDVSVVHDDADDCPPPVLSSLMNAYLREAAAPSYPKRMCRLVAGELAQRFRSGDVFGRRSASAFRAYEAGSAHRLFDRRCYTRPAPTSIDSSEVEFTTLIAVPRPPSSERSFESPHDFSSTTDDEGESSTDEPQPLERTCSLKSVSSCVGAEYEGGELQPPQLETQTLAEVAELTASFTTASDDASVDDVTVVFRPAAPIVDLTADEDDGLSHVSNKSMDSCSISSMDDDDENQLSDSNTYSCLDCVDDVATADVVPAAPEELSTSFVGKEAKFKMELSVIYEEHAHVSADSADGGPRDEKPDVDALAASLAAADAGAEAAWAADFAVKREPASESASPAEEAGSWPSTGPSTFTQSLETVFEAVAADDCLPASDDYSPDESVTDSALGASDLTFVAEPADAAGSYSVSAAVKKFLLFFAHVLNLVSTVKNHDPPPDASPSDDSKAASANGNTGSSTDTHSSAALVQQNSNSEGYTISDTSLVSCIADSEEATGGKPTSAIQECVESNVPIEDVETNTCCSEIEEENGGDNDVAFDELETEPLSADYYEEILIPLPEDRSWSEDEKDPLLADTCDLCQSEEDDRLPYVALSEDEFRRSESEDGSSVSVEKLECCVDPDKVASYYTICPKEIDCGQDELPYEEAVFGQSTLSSEASPQETLSLDVRNVSTFQPSHYYESVRDGSAHSSLCHYETISVPIPSYVEEPESSFPSHHSSCEESDAAPDSSDYFDTVEDASSLQVATESVAEQVTQQLAQESSDCLDTVETSVLPTPDPKSENSDFRSTPRDLESAFAADLSPTQSELELAYPESEDQDEEQLLEESEDLDEEQLLQESDTSVDVVEENASTSANNENAASLLAYESVDYFGTVAESISPPPLVAPDVANADLGNDVKLIESSDEDNQSVVSESNETDAEPPVVLTPVSEAKIVDQVLVEESTDGELGAAENQNIIAETLQVNADAICLSFQNLNFTDILNTKCSSIERTAEESKSVERDEAAGAESAEIIDQQSCPEDDPDKEADGIDAPQHGAAENDAPDMVLRFRPHPRSADYSGADSAVVGESAVDAVETLADCVDWLFSIDADTIENVECVEYDDDHQLEGSQSDSRITDASQTTSAGEVAEQYNELPPASDVERVSDELVAASDADVAQPCAPESCEMVGRLLCDAVDCSFASSDAKIEYDVNSNEITGGGSAYVTAPQQRTGEAGASGAQSRQHRRSSSSSCSSPDTVHVEGGGARQGGGRNSATWCQSGDSTGELSLKLRLKLEWDSRGTTNAERSSSSSGDGRAKRSSFDDDSLNSSESAGAADGARDAPDGRTPRSKLLVEFKHNYPKFIQYTYFSPKVRPRRSPRRAPQTAPAARARKFGAAKTPAGSSPPRNAGRGADVAAAIRSAGAQSADSTRVRALVRPQESAGGQYLRFDDVSPGDWPSFASTEAASKSSLLLDPRLQALSFKTSTPKGQQADDSAGSACAQPPAMDSSLTEFEMWESLLESNPEIVTR